MCNDNFSIDDVYADIVYTEVTNPKVRKQLEQERCPLLFWTLVAFIITGYIWSPTKTFVSFLKDENWYWSYSYAQKMSGDKNKIRLLFIKILFPSGLAQSNEELYKRLFFPLWKIELGSEIAYCPPKLKTNVSLMSLHSSSIIQLLAVCSMEI